MALVVSASTLLPLSASASAPALLVLGPEPEMEMEPEPPAYAPAFDALGFAFGTLPVPFSAPPPPALPSYSSLPSLEPWLRVLRSDPHFACSTPSPALADDALRAPLALFLPGHADGWPVAHAALAAARRHWGLHPGPHDDMRTLLWPETAEIRARVRADAGWLPRELRNTALFILFDKDSALLAARLPLPISSILLDALTRRACRHAHLERRGRPPPTPKVSHPRMLVSLGKELAVRLWYSALPQADFERLVRALFLLRCRAVFALQAAVDVERRAGSRVGRALAHLSRLGQRIGS